MRYLVTARVKKGKEKSLERAIEDGTLGRGSIAGDEYDLLRVQDAHARSRCRDLNGAESWACNDCDCTERLEARLATKGKSFRGTSK
jgi:hypothetical protein